MTKTNESKAQLDSFFLDYPWTLLEGILKDNPDLRKQVTRGGVRLGRKNKRLIIKTLKRLCESDRQLLEMFFAKWFNHRTEYYDLLHEYFNSEGHSRLKETRGVDDSLYVMDDKHFMELIGVATPTDLGYFSKLSPIRFSGDQLEVLAKIEELVTKCTTMDHGRSNTTQAGSNSRDRNRLKSGERKHYEKEIGKYKEKIADLESETRKLKTKINEIKKVDEIENEHKNQLLLVTGQFEDKIRDLKEENSALRAETARLKRENSHYKDLQNQIKALEAGLQNSVTAERKLADSLENLKNRVALKSDQFEDWKLELERLEEEVRQAEAQRERPFIEVVSKLDFDGLVAAINAPDDVLELLENVVTPGTTDEAPENRQQTLSPKIFWKTLQKKENALVNRLMDISATAVADGSLFREWSCLIDYFNDLKCSLSARIFFINILKGILEQRHFQNK